MTNLDITSLKTAIPYIRTFKNKIFVVKLGGEICHPGPVLDNIIEQFALLYQLGIKLVIVHGGGPQATELSEQLGVESPFINGRRITSPEMLEVSKMSFAGVVNSNMLASCRKFHVPAIGISGIDGNLLVATKRPVTAVTDAHSGKSQNVDFGLVGDIQQINVEVLENTLAGGYVPIICSLAADADGQILNVNADTVASQLAISINATKYCLLSRVDGVLNNVDDASSLISELTIAQTRELIESGSVTDGMVPKLTTCIEAVEGGVPRAHIVNGLTQDTLLKEIFTNEGCGTLIRSEKS